MRVFFALALRYLRGRKLRTVLTTLAIVFGVAVLFGMNSLLPTLLRAFRQSMLAATGKAELVFSSVTEGPFPAERLEAVKRIDGVAEVAGSLWHNVVLPASFPEASAVNALTLVGVEPEVVQRIRQLPVREGRFLSPQDRYAAVVPRSLSEKLGLTIGSTLTLPSAAGTADFRIVGILELSPLPGTEEVYVPLAAAQKVLDLPGQITLIEGVLKPGADRARVEEAALSVLGKGFQAQPPEMGGELLASLRLGEIAFALFGVMALAIGAFIILNTFRTVVVERRHDLGMLRAIGASRRAVAGLILTESLLQGALGTGLGLLGGYGLAWLMLALVAPTMRQFMHIESGSPVVTLPNLITAVVLGMGATLAGGLLPAISAARVAPLEALRPLIAGAYERAARRRGVIGAVLLALAFLSLPAGQFPLAALGTLLFVVGLVLVAPVLVAPLARLFGRIFSALLGREGRLAERNLARQPNRAAVTASAIMIGLAMIVALAGMISSIYDGFMGYIDRSLHTDLLIMPSSLVLGGGNVGAGAEFAQAIREVPGVAGVTTLRLGTAALGNNRLQVVGIDPETYPRLSGLVFSSGEPEEAFAALARERALIVNGIFSAQHRVRVGSILTLLTPEGERAYRVVGVGSDYLNAKLATVYLSQANLQQDFHQTSDLLVLIDVEDRADGSAVREQIEEIVRRYPAFTLLDWGVFRASQEQAFRRSVSLLWVIMLMFALPSLLAMVNTLTINVMERTREIGVLRAVGSTRRQVRRIIRLESLLLSALGTGFGILAGLWLSYFLVTGMNVSGFRTPYYFPYAGLLVAIAVGLLLGVTAAVLPARRAARLDIVSALRYE